MSALAERAETADGYRARRTLPRGAGIQVRLADLGPVTRIGSVRLILNGAIGATLYGCLNQQHDWQISPEGARDAKAEARESGPEVQALALTAWD